MPCHDMTCKQEHRARNVFSTRLNWSADAKNSPNVSDVCGTGMTGKARLYNSLHMEAGFALQTTAHKESFSTF